MPIPASPPRPAGTWLRFLGAVTVLVLVTVGIPAGLVIAARAGLGSSSPLPGLGGWDDVRTWATTQRSSTEVARVALRVLISLCWLLWALLVLSVLSSVLQSRPRFGHVQLPRIALFDGFGSWLAAGLTAFSSLVPNVSHAATAPAMPLPMATLTVATPTAVASVAAPSTAAPVADVRPGWATVQAAESIEMFAGRTLGAPERWPEVFELNKNRVMTDGATFTHAWKISAGWQLELPAAAPAPAPAPATPAASPSSPAATTNGYRPAEELVVDDGDNLWDLATARLRSIGADDTAPTVSALVDEIVATNPDIADPDLIYTGQRLLLPAVGTPPTAPEATPAPPPPLPPAPTTPAERTHTVVRGDTLWDILDAAYGYVDVPLVHVVAGCNQLADPNNIPIGTVLRLPDLPAQPIAAAADAPAAPPRLDEPAPAPVDGSQPPVTDAGAPSPPPMIKPAAEPQEPEPAEDPAAVPAASPPPLRLVPAPPAEAPLAQPAPSPVPWAIGGAGSVALATGVVELLRRRRRARWARGGSTWLVGAASEPAPDEPLAAADLTTVEWVAATLSHLAATVPHSGALASVEYDDHSLSVRWAQPQTAAPAPWEASENGWVWNLPRSARLTPPENASLVGYPGLATLGDHAGRQYLINLGALRTVAIDGPAAEALAASMVLELAAGELLSDAIVHLHGIELAAGEQLDRVVVGFDDEPEPSSRSLHVSVIESDDPSLDDLVAAAERSAQHAVVILGTSQRDVCAELRVHNDGAATHDPAGIAFHASLVPHMLRSLDVDEPSAPSEPVVDVTPDPTVVRMERSPRGAVTPPRMVLRVFSNLLPRLDPHPADVDARAMTIIAALDYLGSGRRPQQLAELLRIKPKTVQNKLGTLRAQQLVHSDGNVWTLDSGISTDADWMCDLAEHARDAPTRDSANRALNECWELLTRATGPAYANGGGSPLWGWVNEHDPDFGGLTAADQATATLFQAVRTAAETWDTLAATGLDDLIAPDKLVDVLLRLESTLHAVEPWPLFEAAALAAGRTGLVSTRQKLTTRLAQLVHDVDLDPPDELVAQVIG